MADNYPSLSLADRNVETVRAFLRLLGEKDINGWIELWADDANQYYPFGTEMFPEHLAGKQAIYDRWRDMPDRFDSLSFPVRETWADRDTILARFDSDSVIKGGKKYLNTYIGIFKFNDDGKIREYWEYFDPIIAGVGFGLVDVTYLANRFGQEKSHDRECQ
jgi:ketosteroid isomerase-like protein